MISVSNLSKQFSNNGQITSVWHDLNCTINKGEVVSIIGPSGCGKSTFLRCLNGLEKPTSGKVEVLGVDITDSKANLTQIRKKVGMVFQSYNLFENYTVLENVTLGPRKLLKLSSQEAKEQGMEFLRMVGLAGKADCYSKNLSGGQLQRVAIARCLAMHPDIILMDEPTSALDPTMVSEVLSVIRKLAKEGHTMIIATHEMNFAREVSSRILFLCNGEICEDGTPEQIFEHPQNVATQVFVNKIKSVEFNVASRDYDLYQMNGKIEYFCQKHSLVDKINTLELLLEEFLTNILPFSGNINFIFNFSEKDYSLTMEISQENCTTSLLESSGADEISVMLVKGYCASITEEQSGTTRRLVARLK